MRAFPNTAELGSYTRDQIIAGMRRAFFVTAWADAFEDAGGSFAPGTRIDHVAPLADDPAAYVAAETLAQRLEEANGGEPLANLWSHNRGGLSSWDWGWYAAMGAMGHGVGFWDYAIELETPDVEFSMAHLSHTYAGTL